MDDEKSSTRCPAQVDLVGQTCNIGTGELRCFSVETWPDAKGNGKA